MLYKVNSNGIFFEVALAKEGTEKTLILLPGLPEYPRPKKVMEGLANKGYNVIYPRYKGTFESEGEFLLISPSKEIESLISILKNKNKFTEIYNHSEISILSKEIIVVATSFGGSVALELSQRVNNQIKFMVGSPVIDFKEHGSIKGEQDLNNLKIFLKEGFPNLYRFKEEKFEELLEGKIIPSAYEGVFDNNLIIFHGTNDEAVSYYRVKKFAEEKRIKFVSLEGIDHLSVGKLLELREFNETL